MSEDNQLFPYVRGVRFAKYDFGSVLGSVVQKMRLLVWFCKNQHFPVRFSFFYCLKAKFCWQVRFIYSTVKLTNFSYRKDQTHQFIMPTHGRLVLRRQADNAFACPCPMVVRLANAR